MALDINYTPAAYVYLIHESTESPKDQLAKLYKALMELDLQGVLEGRNVYKEDLDKFGAKFQAFLRNLSAEEVDAGTALAIQRVLKLYKTLSGA